MKSLHNGQRGISLVELLVVIAIVGALSAGIATLISQIITGNTRTSNHMVAVRQVQQAGKDLSQDTLQAQNITAGGALGFPLTFEWSEWNSDRSHEIVYSLEDMPGGSADTQQLRRSYTLYTDEQKTYESSRIVAQYIVPDETSCDVGARKVRFTITASVGGGPYEGRETRVYEAERRPD
jgi:prepilin-type N-terminal cleavage/methylation domain-containing protein